MKQILLAALAAIASGLLGGCSFTQEMKPGVSFKDLNTFYVDAPRGGDSLFVLVGDRAESDAFLVSKIRETLEKEGYVYASERAAAQMIFSPLWNTSVSRGAYDDGVYLNETLSFGTRSLETYCMFELQVYFPDREDWVWRGFGATELSVKTFNEGTVANQVYWALKEFPPEKHPSSLQKWREKRAAKKLQEENPFANVEVEGGVNTAPTQPGEKLNTPEPQKFEPVKGSEPNIVPAN